MPAKKSTPPVEPVESVVPLAAVPPPVPQSFAVPPQQSQKPGKVQAIAILTLISGITNILWPLILYAIIGISTVFVGCLFLPLFVPPIVLGIFEIIYATKLLPTPVKPTQPSQTIAILETISVITGNLVSVAAGIVALVLYGDPEVKSYFVKIDSKV